MSLERNRHLTQQSCALLGEYVDSVFFIYLVRFNVDVVCKPRNACPTSKFEVVPCAARMVL